jgi:hypothetical protein
MLAARCASSAVATARHTSAFDRLQACRSHAMRVRIDHSLCKAHPIRAAPAASAKSLSCSVMRSRVSRGRLSVSAVALMPNLADDRVPVTVSAQSTSGCIKALMPCACILISARCPFPASMLSAKEWPSCPTQATLLLRCFQLRF